MSSLNSKIQALSTPLILSALSPILLYGANTDLALKAILNPIIISASVAAILVGIFFLLTRKKIYLAGLLTTLSVLTFFSYGHVASVIGLYTINTTWQISFLSAWLILFLAFVIFIISQPASRQIRLSKRSSAIVNVIAILTIAPAVYNIINNPATELYPPNQTDKQVSTAIVNNDNLPDIYYIIVDAHARSDILQSVFNFDNSSFINQLTKKGFFVTHQSFSNYTNTPHSLASSLNYEYINWLEETEEKNSKWKSTLIHLIDNNKAADFLRKQGYSYIVVSSGWSVTDYLTQPDQLISPTKTGGEFMNIWLSTTLLSALIQQELPYRQHRQNVLFWFEELPKIARNPKPTFTFAHLLAPHPPFVFGPSGQPIKHNYPISYNKFEWSKLHGQGDQEYVNRYRDQLAYIDTKLLQLIDSILVSSPQPPIIIIQADHGPDSSFDYDNLTPEGIREHLAILNAYYLPGKVEPPPDDISPVNSFRLILNHYFDAGLPLLDNHSFVIDFNGQKLYSFMDVTDIVKATDSGQ